MFLASGNPAKLAALRRAVGNVAVVVPLPDPLQPGHENQTDFDEIAAAKARRASRAVGGALVAATDGGLLVPALGSAWNAVRTRRFAGPGADNRRRAETLLRLAADLRGDDRRIGWREALAVARDGRIVAAWTAEGAAGVLADDVAAASLEADGFWVPPIWVCPEFGGRRLADLSDAERDARDDHWSRLGRHLRRFLLDDVERTRHRPAGTAGAPGAP